MTALRRHDHRLSARPPAFFSEVFERAWAQPPEIVTPGDPHAGRYGKRRTFLWELRGPDGEELDCHLAVYSDAGPPDDARPLAVHVFAALIAMDDAARAIPSAEDENEYLFSVTIDSDRSAVQLGYASMLCNTEWRVHFRPEEGGTFTCLGIPDWRNPGRFIF